LGFRSHYGQNGRGGFRGKFCKGLRHRFIRRRKQCQLE
jgi:hypothetical protein